MSNSYIENLNKLANNAKLEKTYQEEIEAEANFAFNMFISDFKKAIEKIVESGSFTKYGNQRVVNGTISSLFIDCHEWSNDYSLTISTSSPKDIKVKIADYRSYSKYSTCVGPFYNTKHEMTSEGALFGLIKPKYSYVCTEEVEKTTAFVRRFNDELNGFAEITMQYPLNQYKDFKNNDTSYLQKYDFTVAF